MTHRWWYLRRAVPWAGLLGCCAGAGVVSLMLQTWPSSGLVLLPALLACCAAAAAFCFDETTLPVVEVTPRGATWRRVARLAVVLAPLVVGMVLGRGPVYPADELTRAALGSWIAVATAGLAAGAAALRPGVRP